MISLFEALALLIMLIVAAVIHPLLNQFIEDILEMKRIERLLRLSEWELETVKTAAMLGLSEVDEMRDLMEDAFRHKKMGTPAPMDLLKAYRKSLDIANALTPFAYKETNHD